MNNFEEDYRKYAEETVPSYWDSIQKKIEEGSSEAEGSKAAETESGNPKVQGDRVVSINKKRRRFYTWLGAAAACILCVSVGAKLITGLNSKKTENVATAEAVEEEFDEAAPAAEEYEEYAYEAAEEPAEAENAAEEYEEYAPESAAKAEGFAAEEAAPAEEAAASDSYYWGEGPEPELDSGSGYSDEDSFTGIESTTDQYDTVEESDFLITAADPFSVFSADVDTASYRNIRDMVNSGYGLYDIPGNAVRIEEIVNYFDYDIADPEGNDKFGVTAQIGECPWNPSHKLMMIGVKAREDQVNEKSAGENLTFLIDVSGSMDRSIELLKEGFEMLVDELDENDTVSIVTYASGCEVVLDSAKGSDKATIKAAIRSLSAEGSTNGEGGINLAYELAEANFNKDANNRIILATDGDLNVGISDPDQLQKLIENKRNKGIFLTVLGFDNYNYHDANLERLADYGNGNYYYIDSRSEARKVMAEDLTKTLHTVAKDVKFMVQMNPAVVNSYRLIGYDDRRLAAQDFTDDLKDAGEVGAGDEVIVLYELIMEGSDEAVHPKYQEGPSYENASEDVCTVNVRYKDPDEDTSVEKEYVIDGSYLSKETDGEFEFASAAAEFGLVVRNSKYKGAASLEAAADRAEANINNDIYRAEFVSLARELSYTE